MSVHSAPFIHIRIRKHPQLKPSLFFFQCSPRVIFPLAPFFFSFFPLTHITIISPHARTHKQRTIYSKYLLHQNSLHVCLLQIHLLQQT